MPSVMAPPSGDSTILKAIFFSPSPYPGGVKTIPP
jgi:hypothetical protein